MRTHALALSLALPLVCAATSVTAQQASVVGSANAAPSQPADDPAASGKAGATPFAAPALEDHALGSIAGREDTVQVAQNEQAASVSRSNVGDNSVTGAARIDGSAFQNMNGMSILNINTGNNVAINAAMTVNISIQSGP